MTAGWLAISSASSEDIATPLIIPECFFNGITPIVMDFWSSGLDVLTNRPKPDTLYFSSQSGEKEGLARRPAWHKRQASCLAQAPGVLPGTSARGAPGTRERSGLVSWNYHDTCSGGSFTNILPQDQQRTNTPALGGCAWLPTFSLSERAKQFWFWVFCWRLPRCYFRPVATTPAIIPVPKS